MKPRLIGTLVLGALLVLGGGAWLARAEEGSLPPAVTVAGVDVGDRSLPEAAALLRLAEDWRARQPVRLSWSGRRIQTSGSALGAEAEIHAALRRARKSRGALGRLAARLRLSGSRDLPLTFQFDGARLSQLLDRVERAVGRPAVSARVDLRGRRLVVVPSRPGLAVDRAELAAQLERLPRSLPVPVRAVEPVIREAAALAAKAEAEDLLRRRLVVVFATRRAELDSGLLRRALRFEPRGERLAVTLAPPVLARRLRPVFRPFVHGPRSAQFEIRGERVKLMPARYGRTLAVDEIGRALVERPDARGGQIKARFRAIAPRLTTAEARKLRIRELVSEFTTAYPCCAPRVTNIQRAAQILDGTIIPAGGTFSLNAALGPRTPERGFVEAPMILQGRLVDAVGGGVSQVATTVYNAAFFAGLYLIEHTPHQFYISRYPMGREATVSWGGPELVFRNDWPAAVLVKAEARDTSITVRFYSSTLGRRVETETGQPYDYRPAGVRTILNSALPPGTRRIVQHGGLAGFSVSYTRRVYRGSRLVRSARFSVRYDPEDTIVEVGPPPEPKPKEAPRATRPAAKSPGRERSESRQGGRGG